jgi:hypothetical protein
MLQNQKKIKFDEFLFSKYLSSENKMNNLIDDGLERYINCQFIRAVRD